MVCVGHAEAPEGDNGATLFAEVGWAVKNRFAADEVDPIVLEDALDAVWCYPGDIVPINGTAASPHIEADKHSQRINRSKTRRT